MSAPLVVNTRDGVCWTRRTVTSSGIALYAPEGVCGCPEFVMATLPELAEHGITGTADALPVPVGPQPRTLDVVEDELTGVSLSLYEGELATERLRWALASAKRGRSRLRHLVRQMVDALNGHDCPPPGESPMEAVTRFAVRLMEAERLLAGLESLELGDLDGRRSACCGKSNHLTWLRKADDTRACPWCVMELQSDSLVARTHQLANYQETERNFWANQRADQSREAVANLRIAELNKERDALQARVAELEAERRSTNEALDDAVQALRARQTSCPCPPADQPGPHQVGCPQAEVPVARARRVEFAVQYPDGKTVMAETVSRDRRRAEASLRAHREVDPVMWRGCRVVQRLTPDGPWVEAASDALTAAFMPVPSLRASLEDPHDGPLARSFRLGHDLDMPGTGGAE